MLLRGRATKPLQPGRNNVRFHRYLRVPSGFHHRVQGAADRDDANSVMRQPHAGGPSAGAPADYLLGYRPTREFLCGRFLGLGAGGLTELRFACGSSLVGLGALEDVGSADALRL